MFENLNEVEIVLRYTDALAKSIQSIHEDDTLDSGQKVQMIQKSFDQFNAAVADLDDTPEPPTKTISKSDPNRFDEIVEVEKFNPYHDSRGRFSTADGAASFTYKPGASVAHDRAIDREKKRTAGMKDEKPKTQKPKVEEQPRPTTAQEAADYAKKNLGFSSVDYSGMDAETANHVNDTIAKIQERFPELKGVVGEINKSSRPGVYASMTTYTNLEADGTPSKQILSLGSEYRKGMSSINSTYERDLSSGFHPQGTDASSIIWHEYGHALANLRSGRNAVSNNQGSSFGARADYVSDRKGHKLEQSWLRTAAKQQKITQTEFKQRISRYATKNAAETFAEAFAEFTTSKNPRPECLALMKAAGIIGN